MGEMVSICGLVCSDCPALKATQRDDDEERKQVAEMWAKEFKVKIKPEDINCDGCTPTDGRHFNYCNVCEIRKCGIERDVENCAHCADYACEKLGKFFEMAPKAKAKLEEIRARA